MASGSCLAFAAATLAALLATTLRPQVAELAELAANDATAPSDFGLAVSIWGDRVLVGAQSDTELGPYAGAAYVFERGPDGVWTQVTKLTASDAGPEQFFGRSVSLSGDRALVTGSNRFGGAVYVFETSPAGGWVEVARLTPDDAGQGLGQAFGIDVALDRDRALVGASSDDGPTGKGAAYVFERTPGGAWMQVAKLVPSDVSAGGLAGASVALDGDRALLGAPSDDNPDGIPGCLMVGSAVVFERDPGGTWQESAKLRASDWDCFEAFGVSVALARDRALVGCTGDDALGHDSGAAYVFERGPGGTWTETAKLLAADGGPDDHLSGGAIGRRLALLESEKYYDSPDPGAAYLFELQPDGEWLQVAELDASAGPSAEGFGEAVAMWRDRAVVGAFSGDGVVPGSGTAYVFDLEPLSSDVGSISMTTGGTQSLDIDAGHLHGGELYHVLGSATGTAPGLVVGGFTVPLTFDHYFQFTLENPDTPLLADSAGVLDAAGSAAASFNLQPIPALVGLEVWHAFVTRDRTTGDVTFVSNASEVALVP